MPFTVEVALKALITKHNNDHAPKTHDLSELFDKVRLDLQHELTQEFKRIK